MVEEAQELIQISGTLIPLMLLMSGKSDEEKAFLLGLYQQYKRLIYTVAYHYFHENKANADEAMSETVRMMCERCDTLRKVEKEKLKSYLVTMTRNVCVSQYRKIKKETARWNDEVEVREQQPASDNVEEMVMQRLCVEELLRMFDALTERDQCVIRMRYIEQLSYADMAKQLDMSEDNVRVVLTRAKKRLQKMKAQKEGGNANGKESI